MSFSKCQKQLGEYYNFASRQELFKTYLKHSYFNKSRIAITKDISSFFVKYFFCETKFLLKHLVFTFNE